MNRPTTRQSEVFPLWWKNDESWEASQDRIARQRFAIEDDLLYACITYGEGLPANVATQGFTISKGLGYALLLFFARQALGLYRYPYCEDRILSSDSSIRFNKQTETEFCRTIAELTPQRVGKICDELRRLYDHTQNQLSNAGLTSVTLTRRVYDQSSPYREQRRYAQLLYGLKRASDLVGADTVQFEMDSINSFGDDGGYGRFPVTLRLDVPAEDVLYCSNLVASRQGNGHAVEQGEWVVLNRSANGVISLPTAWIEVDPDYCKETWSMDVDAARRFLEKFNPLVLRASHNQFFDRVPGYSGRCWEPTLRARLIAAWRGFRQGLQT
ncbi:MAG: hypothetical protein KAX55_00560 [Propionivibrio sp.]|nr:hypothetical protein [Propionivibrio sp.]